MRHNTGLNSKNLKNLNRGLVLKLIITEGITSRIELSKSTGLTKMTLSNIISEFIESGYVFEKEISYTQNAGRNPVIVDILPSAPKIIGLQVVRDNVTAMLCDMKLNSLVQSKIKLENETKETLKEKIYSVIDKVYKPNENILGIGVSAIGPLDCKTGTILNPTNFFGIENFPVTEILENRYNVPVLINNDMKSAALCEKMFGNGKEFTDFLYVGLSNGVGSGIISDNKLYQQGGFSGEIGHVSIDYNGEICSCGNRGCLELYTSIPVLTEILQKATGEELSFSELCKIEKGETKKIVHEILTSVMIKLSYALVSQVNMLNPQAVIIGHDGISIGREYFKLLENSINKGKLSKNYGKVIVIRAKYGELSPLYGSACCILEKLFRGELV